MPEGSTREMESCDATTISFRQRNVAMDELLETTGGVGRIQLRHLPSGNTRGQHIFSKREGTSENSRCFAHR